MSASPSTVENSTPAASTAARQRASSSWIWGIVMNGIVGWV